MTQELAGRTGALLQARGLHKHYGDRAAVRGLDLEVHAGEMLGLLGPNGAGKTSTVGMICGLMAADQGEVLIEGLALQADNDPRKRLIGLVPQDLALYEQLSARANLQAFGGLYGLRGASLDKRMTEVLALVGLQERMHERVDAFSGGMKRRLNIACALLHGPRLIVLDEPTVGIDPQSRLAIFETLERLRDEGCGLLYTTHYMEEAERLCDRLLIMDHGQQMAGGTLAQLRERMPQQMVLQLRFQQPFDAEQERALGALAGISHCQPDAQRRAAQLVLAGADALAPTLGAIQGLGLKLAGLHTEQPSLEQLFLSLTGRGLRD